MRFATLALAALLSPGALAQTLLVSETAERTTFVETQELVAPGDTTVLSNIPEGTTSISTWTFGTGNYLFGTNGVGIEGFGSAYTLPEGEAEYQVIGATLYVTALPGVIGESFDVSVYAGTLEDGPTGEALYTQTFPSDVVAEISEQGVPPTILLFDEPVAVEGPVFFVTYDVAGITSEMGVGATADLDIPVPETVIFADSAWLQVDEVANVSEGNPLEVYLFGDAIVQEVDPDASGAVSLASARDQGAGTTVTVEGVVTRSEGAFTYLQDETGGLTIRQTSGDFFDQVTANTIRSGSVVRVTGTLSEFNGLLQINGADLDSYEVVGTADVPAPQTVTLGELAASGEDYEGEIVTVEGVTFTDLDDTGSQFSAGTTYAVTDASDASGAVTVRVPNAADGELAGTNFQGNPATVTGVVGQFSSTDPRAGYQILVIAHGDVRPLAVAIGEDPEGRLALGTVAPNPSSDWGTVTVSLAAPGRATLAVYDVLGREVARVLDRDLAAGDFVVRVYVADLPAGTYLARLSASGGTAVRPFTVAR